MNSTADLAFAAIISRALLPAIPVITGTVGEIQPTDTLYCYVATNEIQHVSGNLYTGVLTVALTTPSLPEDPCYLPDHHDIASGLFALLRDPAALAAAWQSDDLELRGTFLVSTAQATETNLWQSSWQVKFGAAQL